MNSYDDFKFWQSGEWQALEERLDDLKGRLSPRKENLFNALDATPLGEVKVVLCGQDPYNDPDLATGLAFAIPKGKKSVPPTLANILREYSTDTHLPLPANGYADLSKWAKQGVLLWNAIPSCEAWKSNSHKDWTEWSYLNRELFQTVSAPGAVFILCGRTARGLKQYVNQDESWVIETSHPSPLGVKAKNDPFFGSRIFTRANDYLCSLGLQPIDWRL